MKKKKRNAHRPGNRNKRHDRRSGRPNLNMTLGGYHQLVFAEYAQEIGHAIIDLREKDTAGLRQGFMSPFAPPVSFDPQISVDILKLWLHRIETRIAEVVSRHHSYYWLHLYRRLAPENTFGNKSLVTVRLYRDILEAASLKHGRVEVGKDLVAGESVDVASVMSGELLAVTNKVFDHRIDEIPATIAGVFIGEFGPADYLELFSLERLAAEYRYATAMLRRAYKGGRLSVLRDCEYEVQNEPHIEALIESYDVRAAKFGNPATTRGVPIERLTTAKDLEDLCFVPVYNVRRHSLKELGLDRLWHWTGVRNFPEYKPNFDLVPFDISSYYRRNAFVSDAFASRWGLDFDCFVACIHALSASAIGMGWESPDMAYQLMQRAYMHSMSKANVVRVMLEASEGCHPRILPGVRLTEKDIEGFLAALTLSPVLRSRIDLTTGGPRPLVIPVVEDRMLIDLGGMLPTLLTATHFVDTNWTAKGVEFEQYVVDKLSKEGLALWEHRKKLVADDGTENDIDVSFLFRETLFVVELKSVGRSFAFQKGEASALAFRTGKMEDAMVDSDDLADWLAVHPTGKNYSIPGCVKHIIPIVGSPFVEYISSRSPDLWCTDEIPRCCSVDEIVLLGDKKKLPQILWRSFVRNVHPQT